MVILAILLVYTPNPLAVTQPTPQYSDSSPSVNSILETADHIAASYNHSGVLNPITVEQSGADAERIGPVSIRTDQEENPQCNLDLDSSNGWKGEQIEVNVRNLTKLYVLNGTFDMGTPGVNLDPKGSVPFHPLGWDAYCSDSSSSQYQRASYIDTSTEHLILENEGRDYTDEGGLMYYRHYSGTYVSWFQQINSIPTSEDFLFSFNLLYDRGPLGTRYQSDFSLRVDMTNGVTIWPIWEIDPTSLAERDVWYSFDKIPISYSGLPASLELQITLDISNQMYIDWDDSDCDDDPSNAKFLTLLFDNVSLIAANSPEFSQVALNVNIPLSGTTPVVGTSGTGRALVNYSFWESSIVPVTFSSNTPVSFEYDARFSRVDRLLNSCYSTDPAKLGVSYSVSFGEDPSLTFFTHIDHHGNYENFVIEITHPRDWNNATIYDSLSSDVTGQCIISEDSIKVAGTILNNLGWWEVKLESPNYAGDVQSQLFNSTTSRWSNESIFRSGATAHASLSIGTSVSVPASITGLDIIWYLPNGSVWFEETLSGGVLGTINSSSVVLGPYNASIGNWLVSITWNNGSEVAYGQTNFEVHHSTSLSAIFPSIEAPVNTSATGVVSFIDLDNGDILLDGFTIVVGNWSGSDVLFYPNLAKDWWEADFNTSITGSGVFRVLVNASNPFYDNASCWLEIHVVTETAMDSLDGGFVSVGLGSTCTASFRYKYLDGIGIDGATLEVQSWDGPSDGILTWGASTPIPSEPGNYSIDFIASLSGTYDIIVTGSKANHKTALTHLSISVGSIETSLSVLNGTSTVIDPDTNFTLMVQYLNGTGGALVGADVEIDVVPTIGLYHSPTSNYLGNGIYSIVLNPEVYGTFSLTISASLANHSEQFKTFTLTVTPLASLLTIDSSSGLVAADRNYTVYLFFSDESLSGLENATVTVFSVSPSLGISYTMATDLGGGNYSITIIPLDLGRYNILFRTTAPKYQNGTVAFTLDVTEVPTNLETSDGSTSASVHYTDSIQIQLFYTRTDLDQNITSATIHISSVAGVNYSISENMGVYILTISSDVLGNWPLHITAFKPNYSNYTLLLWLEVLEQSATVIGLGPSDTQYYQTPHTFTLWFNQSNLIGLEGANISITVEPFPISWVDTGNGYYNFTFTAGDTGSYSVSMMFSKYGYEQQVYSFHIVVRNIPIIVSPDFPLNKTYIPYEFSYLDITLRFIANDTGELITNAKVTYAIFNYITSENIDDGEIEGVDGLFQASLHMPPTGLYYLNITVEKEHYEDFWVTASLNVQMDPNAQLMNFIQFSLSVLGPLVSLFVVTYLGRRVYKQKTFQKRLKLAEIEGRFDDARNVIGFIVLHRNSGLPVYSKMMKKGFEQTLVSSFISAITNFRAEFQKERLWTATPISEIITAVQTQILICALLTTNAPSQTQIQRLESLGRTFGTLFDEEEKTILRVSSDMKAADSFSQTFDQLFSEFMDGALLTTYTSIDMEKLEKRHRPIKQVISKINAEEGFTPLELVRTMMLSGVDEEKAYEVIMDAIENEILLQPGMAEVEESILTEAFSPPSEMDELTEDGLASSDPEEYD